ncbi:hypothetical protein CMK11_00720 [Candidatus Poribacteria bacterium]|nr:hypothetical protein [Candidatus Poribacteria bacterium]
MSYYVARSQHEGATRYYVYAASEADLSNGAEPMHDSGHLAILGLLRLRPGDALLFRAGDVFRGGIHFSALRGETDAPITIGRFGDGPRPVLDGAGAFAAVWLENPSHIVVEGLEITNAAGNYGVYLEGRDAGRLSGITIQDVDVHDVFAAGNELAISEHYGSIGHVYKYMGGIHACIKAGSEPTWWDGFTVRRSHVHDLASCGISMDSAYRFHRAAEEGRDTYPSVGVVIEDNIIDGIGKDGAIIKEVDGAVIQHNRVSRTGLVSTSNGLWYYDSRRSVIRRNEGVDCRAPMGNDGGPFSIDNDCRDCEIVENYSHDNEGPGFMLFGRWGTGRGCVARGNVSYNDNGADPSRPSYATDKGGWGSCTVIGPGSEMLVEDNRLVAGLDTKRVLAHHDWEGSPVEVVYRGNRFCGAGRADMGPEVATAARFEGGAVFEDVVNLPRGLVSTPADGARGRAFAEEAASRFPYGPRETSFRHLL